MADHLNQQALQGTVSILCKLTEIQGEQNHSRTSLVYRELFVEEGGVRIITTILGKHCQ